MIDPFSTQHGENWPHWPSDDTFVIYPGENGPIDSIRWEIFAESLQDYALLQTLDVERAGPLLATLRSFEDFPKSESWIQTARTSLFKKAARTQSAKSG
jgi:hypothetical protein